MVRWIVARDMPNQPVLAGATGANVVVAGITGRRIRVTSYTIVAGGTVTATWESADGTGSLSGAMPLTPGSVLQGVAADEPILETAPGKALVLTLDTAVAVRGHLTFKPGPLEE